ncbi:DUF2304 domain-containing protein [Actinokineospora globicatena]|uniref:DUF2304 domain-containing protein n=1 Tax=Actinokineospora globicatena TaxID=103729 RepID=A0A9W6V9H3_9PSEU|nr:DUF2304 domain-containing protein [Actinokineospora globicatena]MCP2301111.1 hypothetical protein [Actinokineospora globicatena]GLW77253.1 hypothetical protein Aglo01_17350 [Actinokineospora globicatena]GLW84087.1 hypothetical protein Aglo02_17270 [Actinokineospora globicatena]GLW91969.1 hypothetical protein Aglo03_27850 [Actinokineospora globicatena]
MAGWRLLSVVVACLVLLFVVELMRRRKLREKYAGMWLLVSVGVLVFGIFPNFAQDLADLVGVQTASNFTFLLSGIVLAAVSLHLSSEVGHLEEETRTAVEEIALLRCELDRTRAELDARIAQLEAAPAPQDAVAAPARNGSHATTSARS